MLRLELDGRQVVQARVGTDGVVMLSSGFNQHLGLGAGAKSFDAQALVAEFAVERLVGAVLPGFARVDKGCVDPVVEHPLQKCVADELWTVVGTQVDRRTVQADQAGKNVDDASGADTAGDINRQAFVGEFIDYGQAFQLLPIETKS